MKLWEEQPLRAVFKICSIRVIRCPLPLPFLLSLCLLSCSSFGHECKWTWNWLQISYSIKNIISHVTSIKRWGCRCCRSCLIQRSKTAPSQVWLLMMTKLTAGIKFLFCFFFLFLPGIMTWLPHAAPSRAAASLSLWVSQWNLAVSKVWSLPHSADTN